MDCTLYFGPTTPTQSLVLKYYPQVTSQCHTYENKHSTFLVRVCSRSKMCKSQEYHTLIVNILVDLKTSYQNKKKKHRYAWFVQSPYRRCSSLRFFLYFIARASFLMRKRTPDILLQKSRRYFFFQRNNFGFIYILIVIIIVIIVFLFY